MLAATKSVILSLDNFPPEHFSHLKRRVLSGVNLKKGLLHRHYKFHHHSNLLEGMAKR